MGSFRPAAVRMRMYVQYEQRSRRWFVHEGDAKPIENRLFEGERQAMEYAEREWGATFMRVEHDGKPEGQIGLWD